MNYRMVCHVIVMLALGWCTIGQSGTTYILEGASREESDQVNLSLYSVDRLDSKAMLKALDALIVEHPKNRAALMMREPILAYSGRIKEARADLDALTAIDPEYPSLHEMQAQLAQSVGSIEDELKAYQAMAHAKPSDDPSVLAMAPNPILVRARIAELQGDQAGAEKALESLVDSIKPPGYCYFSEYGEYELRQLNFISARAKFAASLDRASAIEGLTEGQASDRLGLANAQWATGEPVKALSQALGIIQLLDDFYAKRSVPYSTFYKSAAIMAYTLTDRGYGTPADKTKARAAIELLSEKVKLDDPLCEDICLAAIVGKLKPASAAKSIGEVLDAAPHMDWALWGDLYLNLNFPTESGGIKDKLYKGSEQRAILDLPLKP